MAEETPQMIPPRMTGHLSSLAPMSDPDFFELVRENGQILIQGLSCKITNTKSRRFQRSGYFPQSSNAIIQPEGETSGANRSQDRVADSAFGHPLSSGLTVLPESQHHRDKNMMNSYPNCKLRNSSLQANYLEVLSELYEDDSNAVLKPNKNCYDEQLMDSHIVPVNNFKFFKQSRLSKKLVQEIPHHTAVNSDFEVPDDDHPNSSKQCEASVPFMRSKEPDTERRDRVNFSIFLKSSSLLKSIHQSSGATRPTSNSPGLRGAKEDILRGNVRSDPRNSDPFEMMPFEQTPMSRNINLMASNMKPVLPDSEPQKDTLPDEQSEAVGHRDTPPSSRFSNKAHGATPNYIVLKENPSNGKSAEQMVSASSACSRGASNNPTYTLKRRYEDTDLSEKTNYTTDEHEAEATTKAAPARGSKGAKRKRKADVHNLSERKRRDKINKKMRALRELIPNCNKVNKASMLDEAIEYLKTLQLQVQMMSMGNGVYMPPNPMMLPTIMQQMNVQHLAGTYSPMAAAGMGMRMQMGMGMGMGVGMGCSPAQFPTLPGITEAPLTNMMGFSPGQVLMMSMSRSPFASLGAARFCPQSVQGPAAATQVELPGAAPIPQSTSKVSN